MDQVGTRLTELAATRGVSLAALSAMIGRNAAYLQQFVTRGTPRALAEGDRRTLAAFFEVDEEVLGGPPAPPAAIRVPRLDVAASAGPGALVDAEVELGADMLDPGLARRLGLKAGAVAIIRVRGDSMEPGLMDGDHILVDTARRSPGAAGGVFVVRIDGALMVKRVRRSGGTLVARSDNPAASPVPNAPVEVVGRVVWAMRAPT
ncbi:S24 family peptidase [Sphingomonas rubra]|uniref:Phage repressor protein C, contains Cro/C1-type HTH and peptisase s24 domains n=1 Tax=Sphingomonas rubra TaxID=634430 RepID=A0A1I5PIA5_9SPHN|nr:S24 family peptidase [Sphingomonas rubra]SFP33587.1 Phage repressor protein C, contains Cro/C1-type HTH and peptisase s24 domains [Sphingomonas rubra]